MTARCDDCQQVQVPVVGWIQVKEPKALDGAMHFQRVTLDYVRNALPGLLGAVGIKLDAVAKQLGAAGDCLESHAIADAGVYCRRGLIGKQEKPPNPAGLG